MTAGRYMDTLRVGFIVFGRRLPIWQVEAMKRILLNGKFRIPIAYGLNCPKGTYEQYPMFLRANWIAKLLLEFDCHLFSNSNRFGSNALELIDISDDPLLPAFRWQDYADSTPVGVLNDAGRAEIRRANLDILVDFGAWLKDEDACLAKYGIWRHVHHPTEDFANCLPGVFESIYSRPVTGSRLEVMLPKSKRSITATTSYSTTYDLSPFVNRSNSAWPAIAFFEREITKLGLQGADKYFSDARKKYSSANDVIGQIKSYDARSAISSCVRYSWKLFTRLVEERTRWDQWYLLFGFFESDDFDVGKCRTILPPDDEFWADPHAFRNGDIYYVFFEVYTQNKKKGHISVLEIDRSGNISDPVIVLEKDYHLSYPMIIEEDGQIYMLPETKQNGTIELYKCVKFPSEWKLEMTLMDDVLATDATPFFHDGRWWMFVTMTQSGKAACTEELFLFYSDQLCSNRWNSHAQNPIVSDARSARPAGKVFSRNGRLIRPSQDCSYHYGYGLVFNEITTLSETSYEEKRISTIRPNWAKNVKGVHSYSRADSLVLLDALKSAKRTR